MTAPAFVRAIRRNPKYDDETGYPFSLPLVRTLPRLEFPTAVTFFVGENGSGKSTLLEAMAAACGAVAVGTSDLSDDATLSGPRRLAHALTVERARTARTRLFLRAEDVFGFATRVGAEMRVFAEQEADVLDGGPIARGGGRERQLKVFQGSRRQLESLYGADPHARSHGEVFLALLKGRLAPQGLYFLDEPETPLSPTRILALIALLLDGVREGSQFIIATHSPILLATPGATIYAFADDRIEAVAWDDVEHVSLTRAFLKNPAGFLRHLTADGEGASS